MNVFYTGIGDDDPRDEHLLTGTNRSRNAFAWASYFHRFGDNTTVGLEWSNWQLKTRATFGGVPGPQGPSGTRTCLIWRLRINSEPQRKKFKQGVGGVGENRPAPVPQSREWALPAGRPALLRYSGALTHESGNR